MAGAVKMLSEEDVRRIVREELKAAGPLEKIVEEAAQEAATEAAEEVLAELASVKKSRKR